MRHVVDSSLTTPWGRNEYSPIPSQRTPLGVCLWAVCREALERGGSSLSGQVAATHGLESHDDVRDLQVSFLLQVGQDPRAEEDFALPDSVQVGVKFQGFDLGKERGTGVPIRIRDMGPTLGALRRAPPP